MVQEVGFAKLQGNGIELIAADSPISFLDDTPTARLIRQVLGAVSEFEKVMLVAKLRGARDRKRRTGVKVEGRKSIAEQTETTRERDGAATVSGHGRYGGLGQRAETVSAGNLSRASG
jgi:DNA invertase Pin-like site-specific DNA recombinase